MCLELLVFLSLEKITKFKLMKRTKLTTRLFEVLFCFVIIFYPYTVFSQEISPADSSLMMKNSVNKQMVKEPAILQNFENDISSSSGDSKPFLGILLSNYINDQLNFSSMDSCKSFVNKVYTLGCFGVRGDIHLSTTNNILISLNGKEWKKTIAISSESNGLIDVFAKIDCKVKNSKGMESQIIHKVEGAAPYYLKITTSGNVQQQDTSKIVQKRNSNMIP